VGSIRPYYRRARPQPQVEADYLRDMGVRWLAHRLPKSKRPVGKEIRVRALMAVFPPSPPGSVRSLIVKMAQAAGVAPRIELRSAHIEPYGLSDPAAEAGQTLERRAAAAVFAGASPHLGVKIFPNIQWQDGQPFHVDEITGERRDEPLASSRDFLEMKFYDGHAPTIRIARGKCLAALAYRDFFPDGRGNHLRDLVSRALLNASPGWCGTIGPDVSSWDLVFKDLVEGNYDMSQMYLIPIAYAYFDELSSGAREHLITVLLARGRIYRVNLNDTFTSGRTPNDWSRAGYGSFAWIKVRRIGETENHILMIATARYLTNQLLYQRANRIVFDNRRNGTSDSPSCTDQILYLLRNILLDDFSEYNAKSYQHETRTALLNLCSYAYDHEVRLAARMALDYVAAHMAVSSNDARRMVPFRRRNNDTNSARTGAGRMTIGLTEWQRGADPLTEHMAMQSGATRAYEVASEPFRPFDWTIASDGVDAAMEMLSNYRLPPAIHGLFVDNCQRRFFQVLHRTELPDTRVTGRNVDNWEVYAASPSYLITAGGEPGQYAINPYILGFYLPKGQDQQLGVAVPTSFMPTGESAGNNPADPDHPRRGYQADAGNLIQLGKFGQEGYLKNFGAAPDFACGLAQELPAWCRNAINKAESIDKFDFVNRRGPDGKPGFYLALLSDGPYLLLEALDTWLHPEVNFDEFRRVVAGRNAQFRDRGLEELDEAVYTTFHGNRVRYQMWESDDGDGNSIARVLGVEFGQFDGTDGLGGAGAVTGQFLQGTVLNSREPGLIEITNPILGKGIQLDMRDPRRPRRTSENNVVEAAGDRQEVWVDFQWRPIDPEVASEGDFFRPFTTLAAAVAAVADGGVIKIVPGTTPERTALATRKRFRLSAPIGDVRIGVRPNA
jgi:hypothetical protein